jgi:hypothetical protein
MVFATKILSETNSFQTFNGVFCRAVYAELKKKKVFCKLIATADTIS